MKRGVMVDSEGDRGWSEHARWRWQVGVTDAKGTRGALADMDGLDKMGGFHGATTRT